MKINTSATYSRLANTPSLQYFVDYIVFNLDYLVVTIQNTTTALIIN